MKNLFVLLFISSLIFTACDDIFEPGDCENCAGVACTQDFRAITILVKDGNGDPVELNSFGAKFKETGKTVEHNFGDEYMDDGYYVIANDANMEDVICDGTEIIFSYSTDGKTFKEETFLVGKDCCHIEWKDSKAQEIIIE